MQQNKKLLEDMSTKRQELFVRALKNRSDIHSLMGHYEQAIADCKRILLFCKRDSQSYSSLIKITTITIANFIARGMSDYNQAEHLIRRTIIKEDKNDIYASGLYTLGIIYWYKRDFDRSLECYEKALEIFQRLGNKRYVGNILNGLGILYHNLGKFDMALKSYKKCLEISKKTGDKMIEASSLNNIGLVYFYKGNINVALKYFLKCLKMNNEIGHKIGLAISFNSIAMAYEEKIRLKEALKYYKEYLNLSEEIGYKMGVVVAYDNIGNFYLAGGEFNTALRYFQKSLVLSQRINYMVGITRILEHLGKTYFHKGDIPTALKYYRKALAFGEKSGNKQQVSQVLVKIGEIYTLLKKFHKAEQILRRAKDIFIKTNDKSGLLEVYSKMSDLKVAQKNYAVALRLAKKSLSLTSQISLSEEQKAIALMAVSKVMISRNPREAISHIRQALKIVKKRKKGAELAHSFYELCKNLRNLSKIGNEHEYIMEDVKRILREIRDIKWVRKFWQSTRSIIHFDYNGKKGMRDLIYQRKIFL